MHGLDKYKLNSNEDALLSAEEMDAQMEADEAAALESLRETAEDFCDFVNTKTYFGDWYAEVVEGKVLIINDVSDQATHEFNEVGGMGFSAHRGARNDNWFTVALRGYITDWEVSRAQMEAKKEAMKGGAK